MECNSNAEPQIDWRVRPCQWTPQLLQMASQINLVALFNESVLISKLRHTNLPENSNEQDERGIAAALWQWRLEMSQLDQEIPDFVLPKALIAYIQENPQSDIVEAARIIFGGFVPPYV